MINLFIYVLGATSILIQVYYINQAIQSTNYYLIKKAALDVIISLFVFMLASSGGVKGFFVAIIATFAITVYLKIVGRTDMLKKEPWFWRVWRKKEKL